jgi:type IV secretory pathway VirB10-like protein
MFSRITKRTFQPLLLFISRVYYAHEIDRKLIQEDDKKAFSFENYPVVKEIFECLELCLDELGQQTKSVSSQSATQLLQNLTGHLSFCKRNLTKVETRLAMASEIAPILSKKLKSLEGKVMAMSPKKAAAARAAPVAAPPLREDVGLPSVMVELISEIVDKKDRDKKRKRKERKEKKKRKRKRKKSM